MAVPDYHVTTTWEVDARVDEVVAIVREPASVARWWPAAFLAVEEAAGPDGRHGSAGRVWSKGWLPYTLSFAFEIAEHPHVPGVIVRVAGDFEGRCVCTVTPRSSRLAIVFDWKVRVHKPVIRRWSWLLRPIFVANHLWVMARGLESLRLELARRRAASDPDGSPLPAPPGPTFPYGPASRRLWLARARLGSTWLRWAGSSPFGGEARG